MQTNRPTKTNVFIRALVSGLSILLLTELILRIFFISPSKQIFDEELGWRYKPNSKLIYTSEGYGTHQLNELGLNDSTLSTKISDSKVLFLGDSFTEALEVSRPKNFISILSQQYQHISFLNAGRGAYAPVHQLTVSNRIIKQFPAQTYIYVMSHGDALTDLLNLPIYLKHNQVGKIISMQPKNEAKDTIKNKFSALLHNSALATYLMRRYHKELKSVISFLQKSAPPPPRKEKRTKKNQEKANLYSQKLLSFVFSELNNTSQTIILYIPNVIYKSEGQSNITDYSKREISIISKAAKDANVVFFNLSELFSHDYLKTSAPAFGFHNTQVGGEGHLNDHGHELVSKFIADQAILHIRH